MEPSHTIIRGTVARTRVLLPMSDHESATGRGSAMKLWYRAWGGALNSLLIHGSSPSSRSRRDRYRMRTGRCLHRERRRAGHWGERRKGRMPNV